MEPTTVQTFSIPPGFKLVSQNTQVGSKSSGQLVKLFGGVVFLLILVVVFMISRQNAQHNEKIKQMEVQQSAMVTPQLPVEPIAEVEVVPESTQESKIVSTSAPTPAPTPAPAPPTQAPAPALAPAPAPTPVPLTKWKKTEKRDVELGDTFHLHPTTNPKGSLETCLKKCDEDSECKGVVINKSETKCWGKSYVARTIGNNGRILYTKSEDGVTEPWKPPVSTPAPAPELLSLSLPTSEPVPLTKWKKTEEKDVIQARNIFHLHKTSNPKGSLETCLKKCDEDSGCKGVVFDKSEELCWGKSNVAKTAGNYHRNIYTKSEDGVAEPWKPTVSTDGRCGPGFGKTFCPGSECCSYQRYCGGERGKESDYCYNNKMGRDGGKYDGIEVPASAPAANVSTNGRCGPQFNNTICPGKRCCSRSSWCGGAQGTNSAWCSYSGNKGRDNGRYDGIG